MNGKTTLQIALLAVILGSAIYLLDEHIERRQTVQVQGQRVFDLTVEPVVAIGFERRNERIEFVNKGGRWFVQQPVRARANGPLVEQTVAAIERMRREDRISRDHREERNLGLSDYGLDPPVARLVVETASGRVETLLLGDPAPFGSSLYAMQEASDEVFTLPEAVMDLFPGNLSAMRDRTIINGNPEQTERIDIHRRDAGFIQLVRQREGWTLQQPLSTQADPEAVRRLLEAVFAMRVEMFHWDGESVENPDEETATRMEMEMRGQIEGAGLAADAAQLRLTLWINGDRLGQEILIGHRDPGPDGLLAFARKGGVDAVYKVSSSILDVCAVSADALRDRSVFVNTLSGRATRMRQGDIGFLRFEHEEIILELQQHPDGKWHILTPLLAPADNEVVNALTAQLLKLRVKEYLPGSDDPPLTESQAPLLRIQAAARLPDSSQESDSGGHTRVEPATELLLAPASATSGRGRPGRTGTRDEWFFLDPESTDGLNASLVSPIRFRDRLMLVVDTNTLFRIQRSTPVGETHIEQSSRDGQPAGKWICVKAQSDAPDSQHTVDLRAVNDMLSAASRLEAGKLVAFMPADLSPFGLETPTAGISFGFRGGAAIQNTILLGDHADDAWIYAMVKGRHFVFLLADSVTKRLLQPLCVQLPDAHTGSGQAQDDPLLLSPVPMAIPAAVQP